MNNEPCAAAALTDVYEPEGTAHQDLEDVLSAGSRMCFSHVCFTYFVYAQMLSGAVLNQLMTFSKLSHLQPSNTLFNTIIVCVIKAKTARRIRFSTACLAVSSDLCISALQVVI